MGVMGPIEKQAPLTLLWCCGILAMATMVAHGDLASDSKECAPILVHLTVCLPYASKQAPKPTLTCCSHLKKVMDNEHKCLCILIRHYDAPIVKQHKLDLDRTINLPQSCNIPANISSCIDALGIDPNSPEAEIFMGHNSSPATTGEKQEKSGSGSSNYHTMGNGHVVSWWMLEALRGFLIASVMAILAG